MTVTRFLDPVANFKKVSVSGTHTAGATTINLVAGEGAKLPDPAVVGAYNMVWYLASKYPSPDDDPNVEIVRVTAKPTANILTVTRGQESITATTKNTKQSGYKLLLGLTKKMIDDIENRLFRNGKVVVGFDAGCDYICDGTADQIQINLAIAEATTDNKIVYLKTGTYDIAGQIDKYKASIWGDGKAKTILNWSGATGTSMFITTNNDRFLFGNLTLDGKDKATVKGVQITSPVASVIFDQIQFHNFAGVGLDGGSTRAVDDSKLWDSIVRDCEFYNCGLGMDIWEYGIHFYGCIFSACTKGVQFNTNSNADFTGGSFTNNGTDIYINGSTEPITINGIWFETSTSKILDVTNSTLGGTDTAYKACKNINFYSCRLQTNSTSGDMMTFTNFSGMVNFNGCEIREATGPTTTTITAGPYSIISYDNCMKMDSVGALTPFGAKKIATELDTDTINEYTTDAGVTIEGVKLENSTITLVNDVNEFSTDTGLSGNSDSAIPTEKAVKAYVDNNSGVSAHNDTTGKQGGTTNEYYHLTDAEHTVVQNTSGVNTGNQDLSGLITKAIGEAKGDIVSFSASATPLRLAVGTQGQILEIDTSTPTGLKWVTPSAGSGTVTQVSVTTANGISGSVATDTTTPAITLTLGAITPTTINGLTITANGTNTLNITAGKTLTVQDNVTITGDLGTAAYTAATAYATSAQGSLADSALQSLSGAVLVSQATPQTIGATGARLAMLWATDITVTNAITGSVTGNAGTVTNGIYTTSQVTALSATAAGDKDKFLHSNSSTGALEWTASAGGTPTAITVANEATDTTCFPLFVTSATGDLGPKTVETLTFDPSTGVLGAGGLALGAGSNKLYRKQSSESVADDGTINLPTGVSGICETWTEAEHMKAYVAADGTVTLLYYTANCVATNTDTKFCLYDGGSGAVIANRLGSTKTVRYIFNYS